MLSSSSSASDAGIKVKALAWSVERWSAGSKRRRLSISSPKKSSRSALRLARREQVDQRPAHGIFAGLGDGVGALVAERVQLPDQRLAVDPLALGDAPGQLADAERGQQPLGRGIGGGDQQLRACRASPAARSASPAARPSPAAPARRGRRAGSPTPAGSAPRPRARTAARCRPARASPLRRRR